ncbi:transcription antitermination factor NusB [Methylohalobius crimeensis]|uniref:transcription antitermination factor NusB n=1 Tax=Methylohalobius crimeensis TaxID=244365 RepID=UPI0003B70C11|nr:transcription antitermination factor NusB [Methylohalobius crimeensis]
MEKSSPEKRTKATRSGARRCALQALYQWQVTGFSPAQIERQFLEEMADGGARLPYFAEILHGVTDHCEAIDAALGRFTDRPVAEIDPIERAILRVGAYELLYRREVPYRAVLNEAINLGKAFGGTHKSYKYVNGVLDKLAHEVRAEEVAAARRQKLA